MPWTKEQQAAIDARNDAVLVSAAAGSGKTAVLVERVLSLLKEGASIDRMLIVTFTRAAAAEMRERIEKALSEQEDAHLRRQAARMNRANISTLHAFCQKFLREHFSAAGVDPAFRMSTDADNIELAESALEEALQGSYDAPTEDEKALFAQFEYEELAEMIPAVNRFLLSRMNPYTWALDLAGVEPSVYLSALDRAAVDEMRGAQDALDRMDALLAKPGAPLRYESALESDRALLQTLLQNGITGEKIAYARLSSKKAPPEEDPEITEAFKALRDQFKGAIAKAADLYPASRETMEKAYTASQPSLRALIGLCEKTNRLFFEKKQRKTRLDFHDLEHLTLKALSDEKLRLEAAGAFDHIFVDEYQDVSGIQESIVSALHVPGKNSMFYVGDVKQSIYRFRSADPSLFMQKYDTYLDEENADGRRILLSVNFRSSKAILSFVNLVFRHAMRRDATEIEYDDAAALSPAPAAPDGEAVEIVLFRKPDDGEAPEDAPETEEDETEEADDEPLGSWQKEAAFIADEIRRLTKEDRPDGKPPFRYRDIVILLRNAAHRSADVAKVLENAGIPVYSDADDKYFDLKEVRDMMTLCKVILNPMDDLTLLAALRCPFFGLTDEELAVIRLRAGAKVSFYEAFSSCARGDDALSAKCGSVLKTLAEWRFLSRNMPLDSFLWTLLSQSGLYLQAGADPQSEEARSRLRLFTEEAQGDKAEMTLADFVALRENAVRAGDRTTAKTLSDQDDVVRIMTLHKSKGLQFPVVFMMECCRRFSGKESSLVRCDGESGLAVRAISEDPRVVLPNPAMSAVALKNLARGKSEEVRLLYVGMTRAQERLYLLGAPRDFEKAVSSRQATEWNLAKAQSMMDLVLDAVGSENLTEGDHTLPGSVRMRFRTPWLTPPPPAREKTLPKPPEMDASPSAIRFPDAGKSKKRPPLKTSVTALVKAIREENDQQETEEEKRTPLESLPERPRFLMEETHLTGSERGTLLHRFLGLADLTQCLEGRLEDAVAAMEAQGFFSPAEIKALKAQSALGHLRRFFASPIANRLQNAAEIHREWEFNLRLHSDKGEYLQGIIDLCFLEDGQWVLCDYKTDRKGEEELKAMYAPQQAMYALALENITGHRVKESFLYSLHDDTAIPLSLENEKRDLLDGSDLP